VTDYLDLADFLRLMERTIGASDENVRDFGLLESALARPRATVFGVDAYPTLPGKAAALLASVCGNHSLIDGNKRMGWIAVRAFCALNGAELRAHEDEAYEFVMTVAGGTVDDVGPIEAWIADRLGD
jgi:death on curing protein